MRDVSFWWSTMSGPGGVTPFANSIAWGCNHGCHYHSRLNGLTASGRSGIYFASANTLGTLGMFRNAHGKHLVWMFRRKTDHPAKFAPVDRCQQGARYWVRTQLDSRGVRKGARKLWEKLSFLSRRDTRSTDERERPTRLIFLPSLSPLARSPRRRSQ